MKTTATSITRQYLQPLKISFDLDEVLFVSPKTHKTEPPLPFPLYKIYKERLRLGTINLIHDLQEKGVQVWIYTSSYRSERYIRNLFRCYHIFLDGIVNGKRHEQEIQKYRKEPMPTKLPSKYRISLHIDDEDSVIANGRLYGFNVLQICEPDDAWQEKIKIKLREIAKKQI